MPDAFVVTFLKGIKLAIVCSPICIDLGLLVALQYASHCPLTVDEATVSDLKRLAAHTAWTSDVLHFLAYREDTKALVYHDKLLISDAPLVLAVAEPAHPIGYLSKPRCILFPCNLLNVLDRIEGEVYPKRHLEALMCGVIKSCKAAAIGVLDT